MDDVKKEQNNQALYWETLRKNVVKKRTKEEKAVDVRDIERIIDNKIERSEKAFKAILVIGAILVAILWASNVFAAPTWIAKTTLNKQKTKTALIKNGSPIFVEGVEWLCRFSAVAVKGSQVEIGLVTCGLKSDFNNVQMYTTAGCETVNGQVKAGNEVSIALVTRKNDLLLSVSCE